MSRFRRFGIGWRLAAVIALALLLSLGTLNTRGTTQAAGPGSGAGGGNGNGHGAHRGQQQAATGAATRSSGARVIEDGTPWTQLTPEISPPPRQGYAMATDSATGTIVLFGGQAESYGNTTMNDTWVWNGAANALTWTQVVSPGCTNICSNSPPARYGAHMAYDPATKMDILFGGMSVSGTNDSASTRQLTNTLLNDTWGWNGVTQTWTQLLSPGCTSTCPNSPSARTAAAMSTDPSLNHVVLFGGSTAIPGGCFTLNGVPNNPPGECGVNDAWGWTGSAWRQLGAGGPGLQPHPRASAALAAQPGSGSGGPFASANVVLFGGLIRDLYDGQGADTFNLNGTGAAFVQTALNPHPFARSATGLAGTTLPQKGVMTYSGKLHDFATVGDTWELSPTNVWTAVCGTATTPACGPGARYSIQLATDPATGTPLLFGGRDNGAGCDINSAFNTCNDTWRFGPPPPVAP